MRRVLSSVLRSIENLPALRGIRTPVVSVLLAVLWLGSQLVLAQAPTWTTKAPLPAGRAYFAAGVIDGIIYAVGGVGPGGGGALDAYDPMTDTWTSRAPMPNPRVGLGVGVVDGILYAVGGNDMVQAYDPRTNRWTARAPLPELSGDWAVAVVDGIVYAISKDRVEAYDPNTNTWTPKAPLLSSRDRLGAAAINGIIYAVGGVIFRSGERTVEAYNPITNTWTIKAPMPNGRYDLGAAALGGVLYAVGGGGFVSPPLAIVESYDPVTDTWTAKPPMPTARRGLTTVVVNDKLYAMGGTIDQDGRYGAVNEAFGVFLPQTITFPALSSRTYGDVFSISATATTGLTVAFTSTTPYVCVVSGTTVRLVGVGTCSISAGQGGNVSYGAAPNVVQSFLVGRATLRVAAQDATKPFGAPIPPLSVSISGFFNGDSAAVLIGNAAVSTTATMTSPVGSYPITIDDSTLAAANYTFIFLDGARLSIVPAATSLLLTDLLPGPSAQLGQAFTLGYTVAVPPGAPSPGGTIVYTVDGGTPQTAPIAAGVARVTISGIGAGTHTVVANYTGDGNYLAAGPHTLTLTVGKLSTQLSLTVAPGTSAPAGQAFTLSVEIVATGGLPQPTGTLTYSIDGGAQQTVALAAGKATLALTGLAVGPHTVSATYSGDANYLSSGPQTLTLTVILGTPTINPGGLVGAAGTTAQISAGGLGTIFGSNLAGEVAFAASLPLPRVLGGVLVLFNGIAAPLFYISPTQINFQAPMEVQPGTLVQVQLIQGGNPEPTVTVTFLTYAPAVFTYQRVPGTIDPVIVHADNTLVTPDNPARPNEVVVIYATGAGNLNNAPASGTAAPLSPLATTKDTPSVTVGGAAATVLFSGLAPGFVGLWQINIQLPATLTAGPTAPLVIAFPGASSAPVNLWVTN